MDESAVNYAWGNRLPTLSATRVILRSLGEPDVLALFEVFSNEDVMRYWSSPAMRHPADAGAYLRRIEEGFRTRNLFQWGIARRTDDGVIGTCTLFHFDTDHRRAELGFALGRVHWGQGIMTEALAALIEFAFGILGLHRLEADADPRNERSLRLLERHGFRREGYLRERYRQNGEIQDAVFLGLLRPEWRRQA